MNRRDNEGIVRNRSKVSRHVRREFLRAHSQRETGRFMLQRLLLLSLTLLLAVVAFPREGMADYTQEEIAAIEKRLSARSAEIRGNKDYNGLCGTCTGVQLQRAGVFKSMISSDGNGAYDLYTRPTGSTPSKHTRTFFPAARKGGNWTITSILNELNNGNTEGRETLAVFCWNTGTGTKGKAYGHVLLVHAVFNGKVYFGESWGTKVRCCTIAQFASDYAYRSNSGEYIFDGAIGYGVEDILNPLSRMTPAGTENNGYYKIARDDGHLKEWPYASAKTLEIKNVNVAAGALTADDILYVEMKVKNTAGNLWARVITSQNGIRYAYFDNLELLYKQIDSVKRYATSRIMSPRFAYPFSGAKIIGADFFGSSLTLTGKYQDATGNIWYKIADDGGYMLEAGLTGISTPAPEVTFTGSYPGKTEGYPTGDLKLGSSFGLRGTVSCDEGLRTVTGRIISHVTGQDALTPIEVTTSAKSYTVNQRANGKCINDLVFGNLGKGSYRYQIDVVTASGYSTTVFSSTFTVGGGAVPASIPVEYIDIYYFGEFVLQGSNNPCLECFDEDRIGFTGLINAAVYPEEATNKALNWTSSNPSVATVKAGESFTVHGVGQTTITAAAKDGSGVSSSFVLNVACNHSATRWIVTKEASTTETGIETETCAYCGQTFMTRIIPRKVKLVESIRVADFNHHLDIGQTIQLDVSVSPTDATNPELEYYMSDPSVATVSKENNVITITGRRHGYTDLRIDPKDGGPAFWGETITVNQPQVDLSKGISSVDLQYLVIADRNQQVQTKIKVNQDGYYTLHVSGHQLDWMTLHNLNNNQETFGTVHSSPASTPGGPLNDMNGIYYLTAGEEYTLFISFTSSAGNGDEDRYSHLTVTPCKLCDDSFVNRDEIPVTAGRDVYLAANSTLQPGEEYHFLLDIYDEGDYVLYTQNFNGEDDTEIYLYDAYGQLITYEANNYKGTETKVGFHAPISHTYLAVVRNKGLSVADCAVILRRDKGTKTVQVGDNVFARMSFGNCVLFGSGDTWDTIDLEFWQSNYITGNYMGDLVVEEGVTSIGNNMFKEVYLDSVSLPDSLLRIGSRAFYGNGLLTSMDIPAGVTEIGAYAFADNVRLSMVNMPAVLNKISDGLFMNCPISSVSVPESVTEIGAHAFENCRSLRNIALPYGLEIIGDSAFKNVSLTLSEIPETLTTIGSYAFAGSSVGCMAGWFTLPASVTHIGECAFESATVYSLRCYQGSAAHQYAQDNHLEFTLVNQAELTGLRAYPIDMLPGQDARFDGYVRVAPEEAHANILFEEQDNEIIKVTRNGHVYARMPGTATVHAYAASHPEIGCDTKVFVHGDMRLNASAERIRDNTFTLVLVTEGWSTDTVSGIEIRIGNEYLTLDGDFVVTGDGERQFSVTRRTDWKKADGWSCDYARFYISSDGEFPIDGISISIPVKDTRGVDALAENSKATYPLDVAIYKEGISLQENVEIDQSITVTYSVMTCPDMVLPALLTQIEDEAFASVNAKRIKLGEMVTAIGEYAFAGSSLKQIYIPATCTSIAGSAFDNTTGLIIYGQAGSYAETYALEHSIMFRVID